MGSVTVRYRRMTMCMSVAFMGRDNPTADVEPLMRNGHIFASAFVLLSWLRNLQTVRKKTNDTENKIIVELIHGQPMRITSLTKGKVHGVDGGGAVRILEQADLCEFLDAM